MNNELQAALQDILGDKPDGYYLSGLFFWSIGIIIGLYWISRKRDPNALTTPEKFSWTFAVWDNAKKVVISLLAGFIVFRAWNMENILWKVGVGLSVSTSLMPILDYMMENWNWFDKIMSRDRDKFPQKVEDKKE